MLFYGGYGSNDQLHGAGLDFGDDNPTLLTVGGWTQGGSIINIEGPVTLGDLTKTTLNYSGANNAADQIFVQGGTLTLNGTLFLQDIDEGQQPKPTRSLDFFGDTVVLNPFAGGFTSITGNINNPAPTYTTTINTDSDGADYYVVTIQ